MPLGFFIPDVIIIDCVMVMNTLPVCMHEPIQVVSVDTSGKVCVCTVYNQYVMLLVVCSQTHEVFLLSIEYCNYIV